MNVIKKGFMMIGVVIVVAVVLIAGSNVYVYATTKKQVNASLEDADCILVLGAGVRNNKPTPMLNDRLEVAIQLYKVFNLTKQSNCQWKLTLKK